MLPPRDTDSGSVTVLHAVQPGDGGVARVVIDLVRAQLAAGLRVAVACPPDTVLSAAVRAEGADTHAWRAGRNPGPGLVRETRDLARVIRTVRPGLVHAHSAKAGLCARLALRGRVPTVYQPHAWSFEAVEGTTAALARRWEVYGARWADRILCVSEAERRTGEAAGVAAEWSVVHNGVDVARFATDGPSRNPAPTVVCVGRLCRQKGQDVLLAAWPVVTFDGTVAACCNQWTVDRRPVPPHLRLGHIAEDDWQTVRARSLGSPVLRMLRAVGPQRMHARYGTGPAPAGYCRSCHALADRPEVLAGAARDAGGRVGAVLDRLSTDQQLAAGPAALVRRMGCARYAHLVESTGERKPAAADPPAGAHPAADAREAAPPAAVASLTAEERSRR